MVQSKFSTYQRSSCFKKLFNTTSAWYKPGIDIVLAVVVNSLAIDELTKIVWTVKNIKSINFVQSKTVIWGREKKI